MNLFRNAALVIAASACLTASARAAITYEYSETNTTDSSGVTTVNVFLNEILTGGSTSLVNGDNGLFGAGFGVNRVGTGNATITGGTLNTAALATGTPASPPATPNTGGFGTNGAAGNVTANQSPADGTNAASSVNVGFGTANGMFANTSTTAAGTTTNQWLLGTFTIAAGSQASTFSITSLAGSPNTSFGGTFGNTVTFNTLFDLDQTNNGPSGGATYIGASTFDGTVTFTVAAAVPEPSSMALCGLAVCGGAFAAYRRRKGLFLNGNAAAA
jgi:hypothetical protein